MKRLKGFLFIVVILSLFACQSSIQLNHGVVNSGKFREVQFDVINGNSTGLLIFNKRTFKYGHVKVSNGLVLWPNGFEMHGYVTEDNELSFAWTLYDVEGRIRGMYYFVKSKVVEYVIYDENGEEVDRLHFVLTF